MGKLSKLSLSKRKNIGLTTNQKSTTATTKNRNTIFSFFNKDKNNNQTEQSSDDIDPQNNDNSPPKKKKRIERNKNDLLLAARHAKRVELELQQAQEKLTKYYSVQGTDKQHSSNRSRKRPDIDFIPQLVNRVIKESSGSNKIYERTSTIIQLLIHLIFDYSKDILEQSVIETFQDTPFALHLATDDSTKESTKVHSKPTLYETTAITWTMNRTIDLLQPCTDTRIPALDMLLASTPGDNDGLNHDILLQDLMLGSVSDFISKYDDDNDLDAQEHFKEIKMLYSTVRRHGLKSSLVESSSNIIDNKNDKNDGNSNEYDENDLNRNGTNTSAQVLHQQDSDKPLSATEMSRYLENPEECYKQIQKDISAFQNNTSNSNINNETESSMRRINKSSSSQNELFDKHPFLRQMKSFLHQHNGDAPLEDLIKK